jgi:hypothetical protein
VCICDLVSHGHLLGGNLVRVRKPDADLGEYPII